MATDNTTATELAAGLRKLAEFVETNPDLAGDLVYSFGSVNVPHLDGSGDPKQYLAAYARAGAKAGATVTKDYSSGTYSAIDIAFGGFVGLHVYADRAQVCRRVVTGTREVTKQMPDPNALATVPTVTVTETIEDVEWVCEPLLAGGAA